MNTRDLWVEDPACLFHDRLRASVDPISLAGLALGGAAGLAGSALSSGGGSTPAPAAPPPQAAPQKTPAPKQSTQQPTFIGGVPTPPPSTGQKTLLGQ